VAFLLDEDGFESPLEDVARPLVVPVDPLRVDAIEVAHTSREIRFRRLDHQVIVVGHQAVRVTNPPVSINHFGKDLKEGHAIRIGKEDLLTSIATARDVIDGSLVFDPQWTCHGTSLYQRTPKKKT
jgi:hypothetical protein